MIHTYNAGGKMIIHGVAVAQKLVGRKQWKVRSLTGPIWESVYLPGKKTDVKYVDGKAAARDLLLRLEAEQ